MSRALWIVPPMLFLCSALLLGGVANAAGASIYLSPEGGSFALEDTFEVRVLADTDVSPVSAAEADISFDTGALSVESIRTEDSILDVWLTRPAYDNTTGTISFSGIAKTPYVGTNGQLITIVFYAKRNMLGNVRVVSGALLSTDAGQSNIISSMRSGVYRIRPEALMPEPVATSSEFTAAEILAAEVLPENEAEYAEVSEETPDTLSISADSQVASAAYASYVRYGAIFLALVLIGGLGLGYVMYRRSVFVVGQDVTKHDA